MVNTLDMKHTDSINDGLVYPEGRPLNEKEIKRHIQSTPKLDVEALLKRGCRKLEDVCWDIEHGNSRAGNRR